MATQKMAPTPTATAAPIERITVKVFSATMNRDREVLGEKVTAWIRGNERQLEVTDIRTLQSSDREFHCVTIVVFAKDRA